MTARRRTFELLELAPFETRTGRVLNWGLLALIIANVTVVIVESIDWIYADYGPWFDVFEIFSVAVFTVEFLARLWCSIEAQPDEPPFRTRLIFTVQPMSLVDLAAIAPFYLAMVVGIDLRFLRVLRLLRIFKLTRYSSALSVLLDVLREEASSFAAGLFVMIVLLVVAASGAYLVEHQAQPDGFGSIPDAMWWAVATLTTVGYGDVTPVTVMGKVFGALVTLIGVGMAALPAGIIASGMTDQLRRRRAALIDEYRHALEDGVIDENEEADLEAHRRRLGLSRQLVTEIRTSLKNHKTGEKHGKCPHCGHLI
jgi:voltage-gated potassium channel